jgi:hypothetical protein
VKRQRSGSMLLVIAGAIGAAFGAEPIAKGGLGAPYLEGQHAPPSRQPSRDPTSAVTAISPAKSISVSVESAAPEMTHVKLTNHSDRAVLAVDVSAFRGNQPVVSDRRRAARNEPLVRPGDEYRFDLQVPLDRLVVTSVLWDDGRVDGDPGLLADERVLDLGKAAQIRRVLKLLRDYRDLSARQTIDELRARLTMLPATEEVPTPNGARAGMEIVKEAVLQDLMAFEGGQPAPAAGAWRRWLDDTIGAYEDWFARIAAR